jgi:hypothetical protein
MFAANPNAIPYFTMVGSGLAQVNDTGTITASPTWVPHQFTSVAAMFSGSRTNQENFSLTPVTDPYRLTWMRCAYRIAVGAPTDPAQSAAACSIVQAWDKMALYGCPGKKDGVCSVPVNPDQIDTSCPTSCLPGPGWFCVGGKHDVPKHAPYVGCHSKVYVWVSPQGTEALAQLTMAILGFAATNRSTEWDLTQTTALGAAPTAPGPGPIVPLPPTGPAAPAPAAAAPETPTCKLTVTTVVGAAAASAGSGQGAGGKAGGTSTPNIAPPVIPIGAPATFFVH